MIAVLASNSFRFTFLFSTCWGFRFRWLEKHHLEKHPDWQPAGSVTIGRRCPVKAVLPISCKQYATLRKASANGVVTREFRCRPSTGSGRRSERLRCQSLIVKIGFKLRALSAETFFGGLLGIFAGKQNSVLIACETPHVVLWIGRIIRPRFLAECRKRERTGWGFCCPG